MKTDQDLIDVAFSIGEAPPPVKLPPGMIWMRGIALARRRAAERTLRITRVLSAALLLLFLAAGAVFAWNAPITMVVDQAAGAACAVFILGFTALQLIRAPR